MIWLIPGVIVCLTSMIYGAVLAFRGEIVRPVAFTVMGLCIFWLAWEAAHYQ